MVIGIDASRAFLTQRTGIEEYSYQVIKHLREKLKDTRVILYIRQNQRVDFELPATWRVKKLWLPYFSSQIRFSWEFLAHPVDCLLVLAHTVPPIHPRNTVVVVHGLEYEFVSEAYSWWARFYMRTAIKNACYWAKKIIAVSKNTKKDLMNLYQVPEKKIAVVYEGYETNFQFPIFNLQSNSNFQNSNLKIDSKFKTCLPVGKVQNSKFLLFVGRLEERKNIAGIIEAFEILKEENKISHKLVLAGRVGYGAEVIKRKAQISKYKADIIFPGYVSEEEKWELLKGADVFLFPTLYEGFGLPILEAQSVGAPVVTSNTSSMPEVAGEGALLVDPREPVVIARAVMELISNADLKNDIIDKGYINAQQFSWDKCATEIAEVLLR